MIMGNKYLANVYGTFKHLVILFISEKMMYIINKYPFSILLQFEIKSLNTINIILDTETRATVFTKTNIKMCSNINRKLSINDF